MVFLSGVNPVREPPVYAPWGSVESAPAGEEWFTRKSYDGKDVIIVLAAGVVLGAALTAKKAR